MKRLRTREFFKDYDPLRKGTISESQFKRVLHVSNINLSEKEIECIITKYKVDNIPNGMVHYANFCENIDRIFTTKSIDKDPLAVVG
jgi:Ca2+-binding EF-hand superfamily protein